MNMTINFGFKKKDEVTYFGLLSHNKERELFFQFFWNQIKPTNFYDGVENIEKTITKIDHISFHKDGTIHYRYFNESKKPDKILDKKLKNTIATMPQNHYLPLLILSIYDAEAVKKYIGKSTPRTYSRFHNNNYYWEIEEKNHFSLVYFLIGSEINHKAMIESHFPSIFNIKASPLLMNYFGDEDKVEIENGMITRVNDFSLLIGYTDKVIPKPSRQMLLGPSQMNTNDRIETAYGIILTPTDEMITESFR